MAERRLLDRWREAVDATDEDCPWPGPRPLTPEDPATLLCGREEDERHFRQEVDTHRLIFLHGFSGIGKTSLLLRGLIPALEASGYVVATCRDWSGTASSPKPAAFLAERIYEQVAGRVPDLPADAKLFGALNEALGGRVVIVLDQFEELIRDAPAFKDKLFAVLGRINQQFDLKVIISLRSEHVHELRDLERLARPYTTTQYVLEEIEDQYAIDVVEAANHVRPGAIDPAAAKVVADRWITDREASKKYGDVHAIGLLHLQAFLFALSHLAKGGPVGPDEVSSLIDFLEPVRDEAAPELFDQALQYAVDAKLDTCRTAAEDVGADVLLSGGAAIAVARCVAHLSSGTFKLVREVDDLLEATLASELEKLRRGIEFARADAAAAPDGEPAPEQFRALLDVMVETILPGRDRTDATLDLFAPREEIAAAADARQAPPEGRAGRPAPPRWVAHGRRCRRGDLRADARARPRRGAHRRAAAVRVRARWLQESDTIRLSSPGGGSVMVALIHDRFGVALDRWSKGRGRTNLAPLYGLTAALGADFDWVDWSDPGSVRPELDGGRVGPDGSYLTPPRILVNLRWRGCRINANLRRVVFVNCDFKGSSFDKCRLEGVTFVNCMLDGLMISDTTIIGRQPDAESNLASDAAPYEVRRSSEAVELLGAYQGDLSGGAVGERVLVSAPPEFPATVGTASGERRVLEPHNGGVTIYGGRTSSFLVRRCSFVDDGRMALRETAGAGFDVVEHRHASSFEVTASRIRHVAFTVSPTSIDPIEPLEVVVDESILAQVWIGAGLIGKVRFSNSALIDIWNGSEGVDAAVVPDEEGRSSRYHGLVGVTLEGEHDPYLEDERVRTLVEIDGPDRAVMARATGMDYRRHPAEPEVR
ncbi:MAG: pentapeptide repeat-containing protein [Acidimicrobiales bacterium]